ncbi:MAG: hypothetical protein IKQ97_02875 [Eubacterium sp.]|nr:hypothetical protein [Eubacterium sp.]
MLKRTYDRIYALFEESGGYLATRKMLDHKISTIHIRELLECGDIEKVSHGNYWGTFLHIEKPDNYRMIEACMTNPKAVICGPSACYYHGLLKKEPDKLFIATSRVDRGGMKLMFPVSRHYFSKESFHEDRETVMISGMPVNIYGVDRSVCDCIRMEDELGETVVDEIVRSYRKYGDSDMESLFDYADRMRVGRIVRNRVL